MTNSTTPLKCLTHRLLVLAERLAYLPFPLLLILIQVYWDLDNTPKTKKYREELLAQSSPSVPPVDQITPRIRLVRKTGSKVGELADLEPPESPETYISG